jgi:hypothetical protein
MNIDNGKSIENFNAIPEFYKEIINCWVEFGGGQTKTPQFDVFELNSLLTHDTLSDLK